MTNPADVLTDEFVERVSETISRRAYSFGMTRVGSKEQRDCEMSAIKGAVASVLREERDPIQTVTYEVRAASWADAVMKLEEAFRHNEVAIRLDIRLRSQEP